MVNEYKATGLVWQRFDSLRLICLTHLLSRWRNSPHLCMNCSELYNQDMPAPSFLFYPKHSPKKTRSLFFIPKATPFTKASINPPLHHPTSPTHHLRTLGFLTPSVSRTLPIFSFHAPERSIAKVPTTNYVLDQRAPGSNSAPYRSY